MGFDIKFKEKNNFEKKRNNEIDINLFAHVNTKYTKTLFQNEIEENDLPKENEHIHIVTSKRRSSDIFIEAIKPKKALVVSSRLKESEILNGIRNHSKTIVADDHVIFGSGNISTNARIENYIIFNNKELAKQISTQFEENNYVINSSNNIDTIDNLDCLVIENNKELLTKYKK